MIFEAVLLLWFFTVVLVSHVSIVATFIAAHCAAAMFYNKNRK